MYKFNKSLSEYVTAVKLALNSLKTNKTRSFLSIFGIMIGVISLVVVVSAGEGAKKLVVGQIEAFGTDLIEVEMKVPEASQTSSQNISGSALVTTFKLKDAEALGRLPNISDWYAIVMGQDILGYQEENRTVMLMGVTAGVFNVDRQTVIEEGNIFTETDDKNLAQIVILGSKAKEDIFGNEDAVGKTVKIKGKGYKVTGVLKERGSAGFFDFDNIVYLPLQTLQKKIQGIEHIQGALFKVKDTNRMQITAADMTFEMRKLHGISDPKKDDFAVVSISEATEILDSVFGTINLLLIALIFISLLVGGIGIMNVMYVAVYERTFEIGLRKAVGASAANIRHQFLFEAIVITLFGALFGLLFGFLVMVAISQIAARFGFNLGLVVSLESLLLGLVFSLLAGIIFGYYPARKAAQLTPIEALRR